MSGFRPATALSGAPLLSLSAVVLDTETTGLDTARARVVQIGAVRLNHGEIEGAGFDRLVNPGAPIPPETTAIHGVSDDDVAEAPVFTEVQPELEDMVAGRVMIGHSIAFDLTILRREHERAHLPWQAPRSLCTCLLARATGATLPDYSMETIAEWLEVEIEGRHTALGDARATAEIYLKLVPLLRDKGIRTLAEAETACQRFEHQLGQQRDAGWDEAASASRPPNALSRVDSYPYRHRVRELMSKPALLVLPAASLGDVLSQLMEKSVSSVFVELEEGYGILTERDLLRALHAGGSDVLARPVAEFMSVPLESVRAETFAYRALGRMARRNVRHLGVVDENGALVGALTSRNLLRQRAEDALILADGLVAARSTEQLGVVWAELPLMARNLLGEDVDPRHIAAIISQELCGLTRRATELGEQQMAADGLGPPPCPYAVLVLGSAGRGESLLAMDQDNAIVFEAGAAGGPEDRWFAKLGTYVADALDQVGVPYCKGGVMASNAEWRKDVAAWQGTLSDWIGRATPEDLLNTDIFFDCLPVAGDLKLGRALRREAYALGAGAASFQSLLTKTSTDFSSALGWFGRIRTGDQGRIDLKANGLLPIFSGARVLAIRHEIEAQSTPERLLALLGRPDVSTSDVENVVEAHKIFLGAILAQQLDDLDQGIQLSNKVDVGRLAKSERDELRWALEQVQCIKGLMGNYMAWN